jgi:hypothetical protein
MEQPDNAIGVSEMPVRKSHQAAIVQRAHSLQQRGSDEQH